jgi:tetratricopeptide (TPR) repeat protein
MSLRRYSDALARYEQACAITPHSPTGWQGKGAALLALGQPEAALAALNEGMRLHPADAELQRVRQEALAQTLLVRTPRLAVDAPEFAQIDDPAVWAEQMRRYLQLRRLPEVEAAANQVLRLDPANVDAYIYKGNAQLAMKQFRVGLATLKQGVLLSWHGPKATRQRPDEQKDGVSPPL